MTNNDYFNKLLQLTGLSRDDELVIKIFNLGGIKATRSKIKGWRTSQDNPRSSFMNDHVLSCFLDGFFNYRDEMSKSGVNIFNLQINKAP